MPLGLDLTGGQSVIIPSKTLGQNFYLWMDFEIDNFTNQTFMGRGSGTNQYQLYPIDATTIGWRGSSTLNINLSTPIPAATRTILAFKRNNDGLINVYNSRDPEATPIGALSTTVSLIDMARIGLALGRSFSGIFYAMGLTIDGGAEQLYLNLDDPDATTWGDGTLSGGTWVEYSDTNTTEVAVSQLEQLAQLQQVSIEQAGATDITMVTLQQDTELVPVTVTATAIIATVVLEQATELQTVDFEPSDPTFISGILHDNTETAIVDTTLTHATLYDKTTGELIIRVNGAVTNAAGRVVIQSELLTADTDYDLNVETVDGQRIMPRGTAV